MIALELNELEQLNGGEDWLDKAISGCGDGLLSLIGSPVIAVGSLAVWQVALIVAAGACIAGAIDNQ